MRKFLLFFLISILCPVFLTCGDFLGFSDPPEPDLGNILKIKLYLTEESLEKLYESVSETDFVPCIYQVNDLRTEALIRVRGFTSRIDPKKSFTVKFLNSDGNEIKYAFETAYDSFVTNRIAMFAYRLLGLPAPVTTGTAFYINDNYMGYYTRINAYSEETLESHYNNKNSELFKANFIDENMGSQVPLQAISEKKFPDDNDFTTLNTLICNAKNMENSSWYTWMNSTVDKDEFVKYYTVQAYLTVKDTQYLNFYVYNYGKILLLPWDNEQCMDLYFNRYLYGNSFLTERILSEPYCENLYQDYFRTFFLSDIPDITSLLDLNHPLSTRNIIDDLIVEANRIFDEVDRAIYYEPTDFFTYEDFLEEKQNILNFLYNRSYQIPDPLY
jgi:hypothetical protein